MKRQLSLFFALVLMLSCLVGCSTQRTPKEKSYISYFDTFATVASYAGDSKADFTANCAAVEALFSRFHQLLDIYNAYEGVNNLYTVNQMAGIAPVAVDDALIELLLYAKEVHTLTGGETNLVLGAVLSLWHDCRETALDGGEAVLPDAAALEEASKHVSIDCLVIDEEAKTVFLTDAAASLDVGAIGKGYVVERAAALLAARGATGYVLNVGGNLRTVGTKPDGEAWVTGITDPLGGEALIARLALSDAAMVTSGHYERYYTVAGNRYHHIIDKDTLYPARGFASVTVYAADSGLADALSTALFCMTYEEGVALLSTLPDTDALWVTETGEIKMTEGMRQKLLS